jgi:hypothetical protein
LSHFHYESLCTHSNCFIPGTADILEQPPAHAV